MQTTQSIQTSQKLFEFFFSLTMHGWPALSHPAGKTQGDAELSQKWARKQAGYGTGAPKLTWYVLLLDKKPEKGRVQIVFTQN